MRYGIREASVQRNLIERLRKSGWWVRKIHGSSFSEGWPDLCVIGNERTCWVEIKRPPSKETRHDGGKLSALQIREFTAMVDAGAVLFSGDDAEHLTFLVEDYLRFGVSDEAWRG